MRMILTLLLALAQTGANSLPSVDVTASQLAQTLEQEKQTGVTDTPIRTVDAGGHHVGIALVHRPKGAGGAAALHNHVSEVYQVLEGSGTLVTGGTILNPAPREVNAARGLPIGGPGIGGSAIQGGVSRRISKGDMVIIPAGTPHWFSEIQEPIAYTVVRVDPTRVVPLK